MHTLNLFLEHILSSDLLHAKWLNTLSFLENAGARKIAACEHPTLVKEEMLKHAAEEFRHAHHLKRQIGKLQTPALEDYSKENILGGLATFHYLNALDLGVSRLLTEFNLPLKEGAYLLVTYAIEKRAEALYPIYHTLLKNRRSPISVKSILLEEKEHLQEMEEGLAHFPQGQTLSHLACSLERTLYENWLTALGNCFARL